MFNNISEENNYHFGTDHSSCTEMLSRFPYICGKGFPRIACTFIYAPRFSRIVDVCMYDWGFSRFLYNDMHLFSLGQNRTLQN